MDVEVVRPGVLRVEGDRRLEQLLDLLRAPERGSVPGPVLPGLEQHERLGVEGLHAGVVREGRGRRAHGLRIGLVERVAVPGDRGRRPRRGGRDECLLEGRGPRREARGLDRGDVGPGRLLRGHRVVVHVHGEDVRDAPPRHGALRRGLGRPCEARAGLVLVEAPQVAQALVEPGLGLGRGAAHRPGQGAERRHLEGPRRQGGDDLGRRGQGGGVPGGDAAGEQEEETGGGALHGRDHRESRGRTPPGSA